MKINRINLSVIVILTALAVVGTIILRTQAQNSGIIHGCYKRNNGQLRVESSAGQCNPSESEISWNSTDADTFDAHHKSIVLTAAVNDTVTFPLPVTNAPIRFDISVTGVAVLPSLPDDAPVTRSPVTLMTGLLYSDTENNEVQILPFTPGVDYRPIYNYTASGQDSSPGNLHPVIDQVLVQHDATQVFLKNNGSNCELRTDVSEEIYRIQTPQVTYRVNLWY